MRKGKSFKDAHLSKTAWVLTGNTQVYFQVCLSASQTQALPRTYSVSDPWCLLPSPDMTSLGISLSPGCIWGCQAPFKEMYISMSHIHWKSVLRLSAPAAKPLLISVLFPSFSQSFSQGHAGYERTPELSFYTCLYMKAKSESESCSVVSDSLQPPKLYSLWNSPCQNTGVGILSLFRGAFPTQGSNPGLLHCSWILYKLSHNGSARILQWVAYPFSSGTSGPRNGTEISCTAGRFFTNWAIRKC